MMLLLDYVSSQVKLFVRPFIALTITQAYIVQGNKVLTLKTHLTWWTDESEWKGEWLCPLTAAASINILQQKMYFRF